MAALKHMSWLVSTGPEVWVMLTHVAAAAAGAAGVIFQL
jgi:hypothetical protein